MQPTAQDVMFCQRSAPHWHRNKVRVRQIESGTAGAGDGRAEGVGVALQVSATDARTPPARNQEYMYLATPVVT